MSGTKMALSLKNARNLLGFEPGLYFYEAEYYLKGDAFASGKQFKNSKLYQLVKRLTGSAHPTQQDEFDKRWTYFYLPLRRSGKLISVPFGVVKYRGFHAYFHLLGSISIAPGKEKTEKWYADAFKEALRFIPIIKKTQNKAVEKTLPYDFRTGKIKGKYVLGKTMPARESRQLLEEYEEHAKKQSKQEATSLDDYLDAAAICYRAAYGKQTKGLTPEQMYWKWADKRHGGMLDIKNRKSREEFADWYKHGGWAGAHPFEIVFSWHRHGIHLYPPSQDKPAYGLRVTNYAYAPDFVKMLKALIKNNVPVTAYDLKEVLEYLAGESYFAVNDYEEHYIRYFPSKEDKKQYFKHVEWDPIQVVKWK